MTSPYAPISFPSFSCAIGCALASPWPSKPALTQCLLKYSHSSLTLVSLFSSSWQRSCHHSETGRTGRNHEEVLLRWEVLMGVVRQFLTPSSLSEVARPGRQPVAGSLCSLSLFYFLSCLHESSFSNISSHQLPQRTLKLLRVARNQSWNHRTTTSNNAIKQILKNQFTQWKKKSSVLSNNFSYQT